LLYLHFDLSDNAEGPTTLEAMASTTAEHHAAARAEAQQVLDWAWQQFPHSHGPADDGMDWDHDLQVHVEDGCWHTVTLTLTGSPQFVEAFQAAFGSTTEEG
jgi:VCBS repeat-containing protein